VLGLSFPFSFDIVVALDDNPLDFAFAKGDLLSFITSAIDDLLVVLLLGDSILTPIDVLMLLVAVLFWLALVIVATATADELEGLPVSLMFFDIFDFSCAILKSYSFWDKIPFLLYSSSFLNSTSWTSVILVACILVFTPASDVLSMEACCFSC